MIKDLLRRGSVILQGALLLATTLAGTSTPVQAQSPVVAFQHVNVLTMERERVLEDHTVVIQGGIIQEVAPSHRVELPDNATVYDGEGRFLMPGLADMFVRLPGSGTSEELLRDIMFLFLANNITTVRGGVGQPYHLTLKRRVRNGEILGPTIYVAAPTFERAHTEFPDSTVELMLANRARGYDFQVTGRGIPLMSWDTMAEEAHQRGYTFGGLIPDSVGLRYALSTGISVIDHMDGYLEEVVSDSVEARLEEGEAVPLWEMVNSTVGRKMRAMAAHTRSSDSWVVPTLHAWENLYRPLDIDSTLALPEMGYVPGQMIGEWLRQKDTAPVVSVETALQLVEVRRRIFRALVMAGAGVLMGTDSPRLFHVPGFSLRDEIRSMEAAGLTPYEVLVTGTRNVAEFAQRELLEAGNFGIIAEGNRADLILLNGNPFEELEALWDQEGVMVRGRWISREEIDARLAGMAQRNGG